MFSSLKRKCVVVLAGLSLALSVVLPGVAQTPTEVRIAVAANFFNAANSLVSQYYTEYGRNTYTFTVISGATGNFLAQLMADPVGSPSYDLFLAADTASPETLYRADPSRADEPINYAIGQLALYSNAINGPDITDAPAVLLHYPSDSPHQLFVVADPDVAPYGNASRYVLYNYFNTGSTTFQYVLSDGATMNQANVYEAPDIGQAYNAIAAIGSTTPLGFIAHSYACSSPPLPANVLWVVPTNTYPYPELLQAGAVLINRDTDKHDGAEDFLAFITDQSDAAVINIITNQYCYALPPTSKSASVRHKVVKK
ncbi:MAG: substrate-binding domain-containing protein [Candidatus Accumulibacter sp.]|jgi:ABC-type molybdate transport system substrate-binding protein|nr:substrate-binding domain-containing protein [Accumulibacter sp.]